jgi:hypothetical protein
MIQWSTNRQSKEAKGRALFVTQATLPIKVIPQDDESMMAIPQFLKDFPEKV